MARPVTPLRIAIASSGRTQRELAHAISQELGTRFDETKLSRIVNGRQHADDATRVAIAQALGQTVENLWPDDEQAVAA